MSGADGRADRADPADGAPPVGASVDVAAIADGPDDALLDDGVGAPTGSDDVLATRLRWVRRIAWIASICVALGLFAYSVHIYRRFDLTTDFAIPNQAWSQIAHGHLNPYSTLNPYYYPHYGYSFWQDHFSLIFWPLALLWFLYPHSIDLLLVQDVGLAGSILVATLFLVDLIEAEELAYEGARDGRHSPDAGGSRPVLSESDAETAGERRARILGEARKPGGRLPMPHDAAQWPKGVGRLPP